MDQIGKSEEIPEDGKFVRDIAQYSKGKNACLSHFRFAMVLVETENNFSLSVRARSR